MPRVRHLLGLEASAAKAPDTEQALRCSSAAMLEYAVHAKAGEPISGGVVESCCAGRTVPIVRCSAVSPQACVEAAMTGRKMADLRYLVRLIAWKALRWDHVPSKHSSTSSAFTSKIPELHFSASLVRARRSCHQS